MPKTIIKIITWRCPVCEYAQNEEPTREFMNVNLNTIRAFPLENIQANECPNCAMHGNRQVKIEITKVDSLKSVVTVMGNEDIEPEIEERDEVLYRKKMEGEIESHIGSMKDNDEIVSGKKETKIREEKLLGLEEDIERKKNSKFFLTTQEQIDAYRVKRKQDIVDEIAKNRLLEDKE